MDLTADTGSEAAPRLVHDKNNRVQTTKKIAKIAKKWFNFRFMIKISRHGFRT
jgi:hypothetical protein